MQTENLYFLLICAISENFEGKIGELSQKMREIQNILEKKGWAYWFCGLDASGVTDCSRREKYKWLTFQIRYGESGKSFVFS